MNVKHNYTCSLCSKQKTCFAFTNFSMIFAICRDCYDELFENILIYEEDINSCSLCENFSVVKKVNGFENSTFFGNFFICSSCFNKLQNIVNKE